MRRKLILRCDYSPGDIVMLTAAVRDLHRCNPGVFLTDVRTRCPALWEHNAFITPLADDDPEAEVIQCEYPLINDSNRLPYHCLHGFMQMLSQRLGVRIEPGDFAGHVPLAPIEKKWMSQIHELTGEDTPFWVIVAGGKFDATIKWWEASRFQRVVDHFRGRIQFVQVGRRGHYHPRLEGVIDLRGKTDLRQLIRLIHHSQGVLCPVTCAMHLAAAVERKDGVSGRRPCVVIAGGREPEHWEAYPGHQFIHTIGALRCCDKTGCWKARTVPLEDEDERNSSVCRDVVHELPRCMDMISAQEVIDKVDLYFKGGVCNYLTRPQSIAASKAVEKTDSGDENRLSIFTARERSEHFLRHLRTHHAGIGRGIVIPAGGPKYLPCAWVCISMLRRAGCRLPIQLWHLGPEEMDKTFASLVTDMNVQCIDGLEVRKRHPARRLHGWELKCYAVLQSGFKEVLLLDADNVPLVNPEFLFGTQQYQETGAIFWPDYGQLAATRPIWTLTGVSYRAEPEFETGQIVVDLGRCERAMRLAMWYNEHSDFFYKHIHGDKDTFHLAFRKTATPYAMPATPIHSLDGVMCQHDFDGRRIFQHRNSHKWRLEGNRRIEGFALEDQCIEALERLRGSWTPQFAGVLSSNGKPADKNDFASLRADGAAR